VITVLLSVMLTGSPLDLPPPPMPNSPPRALGTDWSSLSPLLRVRPFELASIPDTLRGTVTAGLGTTPVDGMRIAVVVDTPETVGVIGPATAQSWQRSDAEVLAVARAHTRAALQTDLERIEQDLPSLDGRSIRGQLWTGGDTVAIFSDPAAYLSPTPHGALLVAPTRDMVLVYTLTADSPLPSVLATFAALALMETPAEQVAFSQRVFWWHDGQLRALSAEDPTDGRPRVVPGPDLEALERELVPTTAPSVPHRTTAG